MSKVSCPALGRSPSGSKDTWAKLQTCRPRRKSCWVWQDQRNSAAGPSPALLGPMALRLWYGHALLGSGRNPSTGPRSTFKAHTSCSVSSHARVLACSFRPCSLPQLQHDMLFPALESLPVQFPHYGVLPSLYTLFHGWSLLTIQTHQSSRRNPWEHAIYTRLPGHSLWKVPEETQICYRRTQYWLPLGCWIFQVPTLGSLMHLTQWCWTNFVCALVWKSWQVPFISARLTSFTSFATV